MEYKARKRMKKNDKSLGTTSLQEKGCNRRTFAVHKDLQLRISCRGFSSQAPSKLQQVRTSDHGNKAMILNPCATPSEATARVHLEKIAADRKRTVSKVQ